VLCRGPSYRGLSAERTTFRECQEVTKKPSPGANGAAQLQVANNSSSLRIVPADHSMFALSSRGRRPASPRYGLSHEIKDVAMKHLILVDADRLPRQAVRAVKMLRAGRPDARLIVVGVRTRTQAWEGLTTHPGDLLIHPGARGNKSLPRGRGRLAVDTHRQPPWIPRAHPDSGRAGCRH